MERAADIEKALADCLCKWDCHAGENVKATGAFIFTPEFPVFNGHFPGNPILPAFVQMAMIRMLVQRALGKTLRPTSVGRLKFNGMVRPEESLEAAVDIHVVEEGWRGSFVLKSEGHQVASGGIVYSEKCKVKSAK